MEITAASANREYVPGVALTDNGYSITSGTTLGTGDAVHSVTVTGSQEVKGSSANVASNAIIKNGSGNEVTDNYSITYIAGVLAVDVATQTITATDLTIVYDGMAHSLNEIIASTNGDSVLTYTVDGDTDFTITNPGTVNVLITAPGTDKYAPATKTVKLTVAKRPITIASPSVSKIVGNSFSAAETGSWYISAGSLVEGDVIDDAEFKAEPESEPLAVGTYVNKMTGVSNDTPVATIQNSASVDVSDCYEITFANGLLTVKPQPVSSGSSDGSGSGGSGNGSGESEGSSSNVAVTPASALTTPVSSTATSNSTGASSTGTNNDVVGSGTDSTNADSLNSGNTNISDNGSTGVTDTDRGRIISNEGGVIIRLIVDNELNKDKEPPTQNKLDELALPLLATLKDDKLHKEDVAVVFKAYIDVILEKKVNDEDWQKLLTSGEGISVTVDIPPEFISDTDNLFLALMGENGYTVIEDMDNDPNTITFITNDFSQTYTLLALERKTGLLTRDCYWHWLILLMLILSALTVILWWYEEEEEDENGNKIKTGKRLRKKGYFVLVVLFNGAGAVFVYLGHCRIDLPLEIFSVLLTAVLGYIISRKNSKDEEQTGKEF